MFQRANQDFFSSLDNVAEVGAMFLMTMQTAAVVRVSMFSFSYENLEKHGPID
jgi:hypothetical protein